MVMIRFWYDSRRNDLHAYIFLFCFRRSASTPLFLSERCNAEICIILQSQPYLLDTCPTPIVPEQPAFSVPEGIRFIDGIRVPLLGLSWPDDRIGWVAFPVRQSIRGMRKANLRVVDIGETNIEH